MRASHVDECTLTYEPIVNKNIKHLWLAGMERIFQVTRVQSRSTSAKL